MATVFSLGSPAFPPGGQIPRGHTCEGEDVSPPLRWSGAPDGTAAFALVVDDRDARGFIHWVVADIPPGTTEMAAGLQADPGADSPAGGSGAPTQGRNDFGRQGWGGPCPPRGSGDHRYVFTLWALSNTLGLGGNPSGADVRAAAAARSLGSAVLEGTFRR
jgi:Raf kinase inhibitor-like YbhB/YbcL family protein